MGAVVSLFLGLASLSEVKKAATKQQEQQKLQRRRSVRQLLRERQMKRAEAQHLAAATGLTGSSAAAGGLSSLAATGGSALGYSGAMSGLSREITSHQAMAQQFSGLSSLAGQLPSGFELPTVTVGGSNSLFGGNSWG